MSQEPQKQPATEAAETDDLATVSPGERLKNARHALGLTVAEVSTHLKLSEKKIEALERGDAASVAGPVFVAGYLRSYARLLELPEEQVLADFGALSAIESSIESQASNLEAQDYGRVSTRLTSGLFGESVSASSSLVMTVVVALLLFGVVYFMLKDNGVVDKSLDVVVSAVTKAPTDNLPSPRSESVDYLDNSSDNISGDNPDNKSDDSQMDGVVAEMPAAAVDETGSAVSADVADASGVTVTETENHPRLDESASEALIQSELALFFNDDSWVEVSDARGERLIYRLGKAGMARTVMGVAPFEVQLGYVPGVEIMYNGVSYDLTRFAGRRSARFHVGKSGDRMGDG